MSTKLVFQSPPFMMFPDEQLTILILVGKDNTVGVLPIAVIIKLKERVASIPDKNLTILF